MKKIFFLITITLCVACKKDKLRNEYSILEGKWTWGYTEHYFGWCYTSFGLAPEPQYKIITPTTDSNSYQIEFFDQGKIAFYKNEKIIQKNRIVFKIFALLDNGEYHFYIKLDNKEDNIIGGSVIGDSLRIKYPYVEEDPNCENYLNFFVRE